MTLQTIKRIALAIVFIIAAIVQIAYINGRTPWFNIVFLLVLIITTYRLSPKVLIWAAFGGFLLEAAGPHSNGIIIITMLVMSLVMILINRTIFTHTSAFSLTAIAFIGATIFGLGMILEAFVASTFIYHHAFTIANPFGLLWRYYAGVLSIFSVHVAIKAGLDRWSPRTHQILYGSER